MSKNSYFLVTLSLSLMNLCSNLFTRLSNLSRVESETGKPYELEERTESPDLVKQDRVTNLDQSCMIKHVVVLSLADQHFFFNPCTDPTSPKYADLMYEVF